MQFWEGYFLQWVREGTPDSDANFDSFVLNVLAEKNKQIAELQAQILELKSKAGDPATAVRTYKSRGLAKMKLISERGGKKPGGKEKSPSPTTGAPVGNEGNAQRPTGSKKEKTKKDRPKNDDATSADTDGGGSSKVQRVCHDATTLDQTNLKQGAEDGRQGDQQPRRSETGEPGSFEGGEQYRIAQECGSGRPTTENNRPTSFWQKGQRAGDQ
jgi:hypothetical protein